MVVAATLDLAGGQRIVIAGDPPRFSLERAGALIEERPRITIARFVEGAWRWRWDRLVFDGVLFVRGAHVVDGESCATVTSSSARPR